MPADPITAGLELTKALLPLAEKAGTSLYHVVREHATVSGGMTVCRRRITAAESLVRPWVGNDHLAKGSHVAYTASRKTAVALLEAIEKEESWYKRFQLCRECRHVCRRVKTLAYTTSASSLQNEEDAVIAENDARKAEALALAESRTPSSSHAAIAPPSHTLAVAPSSDAIISPPSNTTYLEARITVQVTISSPPTQQLQSNIDGFNALNIPSNVALVSHADVVTTPEVTNAEDGAESVYEDAVSVLHA